MMIAIVADRTCGKSGHVTFCISAMTVVVERDATADEPDLRLHPRGGHVGHDYLVSLCT